MRPYKSGLRLIEAPVKKYYPFLTNSKFFDSYFAAVYISIEFAGWKRRIQSILTPSEDT